MTTANSRVELQKSLFFLIQNATSFDESEEACTNRPFLQTRLEILEQNWKSFNDNHEAICLSLSGNLVDQQYIREKYFERAQAFYAYARSQLMSQLENVETPSIATDSVLSEKGATASKFPRSALPKIKIPPFSGDYKMWRAFRDLFTSLIINNPELSLVEKMQYLKISLQGEAARLVINLSASGENFDIAWTLLNSRYENKRSLISAQLDRISSCKPLKAKSAQGLRALQTTLLEALGALRTLDCEVDKWDPLLLHQVTKLLDAETREDWELSIGSLNDYPTMTTFNKFLDNRTRALENLSTNTHYEHNKENQRVYATTSRRNTAKSIAHATTYNPTHQSDCLICKEQHPLFKCDKYLRMNAKDRNNLISKGKRCFNCLGSHQVKHCKSTRRCLSCGRKHHTTLHSKDTQIKHNQDFSATCRALLRKQDGEFLVVRLLLDQGAEKSLIEEDTVRQAGLKRYSDSTALLGIGGVMSGKTRGRVTIQLNSIYDKRVKCTMDVLILPRLTASIPPFSLKRRTWPHIKELLLADPDYASKGSINIIIGADHFGLIIKYGLIKGDASTPLAQETIFGWALSGPTSLEPKLSTSINVHHYTSNLNLRNLISKFWNQEEIHSTIMLKRDPEEEKSEQHFVATHSRDETGRYVVRLPFKEDPITLGESKVRALGCLKRMTQRFVKEPSYHDMYAGVMNELKKMGHMIKANHSEENAHPSYYLAHHGVVREESRTTKLRVVFNGSG
ncbi:uncharacterized protein [Cardiocondyla obscurior]|uniref:uncharacterized protein n=1 Tax=Cardiocondyla obscurior TaxID=286306 RepID=UPI0039658AD7